MQTQTTNISSKGQIVIPKTIRSALGLRQHDTFQVEIIDGVIVLTPIRSDEWRHLKGFLAGASLTADLEAERAHDRARDK